MIRSSVLSTLLERNGELHPQYGGGLSNHVSMALLALSGLGARDEQLVAYAEVAMRKLEPIPSWEETVDRMSWQTRLGQQRAYRGYERFFLDEITHHGRSDVLARTLPVFLPGLASAGFHCLIRTAYAARFECDEELARGLAYWASHYRDLGIQEPGTTTSAGALELWQRVRSMESLTGKLASQGLIVDDLAEVAKRPGFDRVADVVTARGDVLAQIAEVALAAYGATRSFTALHMVTATHAYRVLEPFLPAAIAGRGRLWQMVTAAYVSIGAPEIPEFPRRSAPPWDEVLDRARRSPNEHVIKMVDTCREEESTFGDPRYRQVAARVAGAGT
jgi:hypothetical protein